MRAKSDLADDGEIRGLVNATVRLQRLVLDNGKDEWLAAELEDFRSMWRAMSKDLGDGDSRTFFGEHNNRVTVTRRGPELDVVVVGE